MKRWLPKLGATGYKPEARTGFRVDDGITAYRRLWKENSGETGECVDRLCVHYSMRVCY